MPVIIRANQADRKDNEDHVGRLSTFREVDHRDPNRISLVACEAVHLNRDLAGTLQEGPCNLMLRDPSLVKHLRNHLHLEDHLDRAVQVQFRDKLPQQQACPASNMLETFATLRFLLHRELTKHQQQEWHLNQPLPSQQCTSRVRSR